MVQGKFMSKYTQKSGKWIYQPGQAVPFRLSRSKIDMFLECPRCFYLDRRLGLGRPSMPGFSLNSAVDELLKKEFDLLRREGQAHELMKQYGIEAIPFSHPDLEKWRANFVGVSFVHPQTNLEIFGAVDDVWINKNNELIIVDYKSTSTQEEISLESEYKQGYKRQMEIYQWLFRKNGFKVSTTGYFVFANADKNLPKFDGRLDFKMSIIEHAGKTDWVEPKILKIYECLNSEIIPESGDECEYCAYRLGIGKYEQKLSKQLEEVR